MPGSGHKQLLHILQAPVSALFFFCGSPVGPVCVNILTFSTLSGQINVKLAELGAQVAWWHCVDFAD